jgi:hypothetical protein
MGALRRTMADRGLRDLLTRGISSGVDNDADPQMEGVAGRSGSDMENDAGRLPDVPRPLAGSAANVNTRREEVQK